ncbi:MAG: hypothetical protein EAX86_01355 [Candidatus Heimdallarchaeota archaeon]|nr:hypothetical protein [Candidatus Heimdallarchaeota archaeon]
MLNKSENGYPTHLLIKKMRIQLVLDLEVLLMISFCQISRLTFRTSFACNRANGILNIHKVRRGENA